MWVDRGKHACVDLTGVSSLVELRIEAFNVEQTTFKTALSKVGKHEKTCSDNQHVLYYLCLTLLAPEIVSLLRRVQMVMHSDVGSHRSMDIVFKRVDFAI
jgi:hypothetical protein